MGGDNDMGTMETGVFEGTERLVMFKVAIEHFTTLLNRRVSFSLAGFSDAEWYCILGKRLGTQTGLGQIIDADHGALLADVIRKRCDDPRFLFAIPSCLWQLPEFEKHDIDKWLIRENIERFEFYERDRLTDELAERAGLYPFINQLKKMSVVIIGNRHLRGLDFLDYREFFEIETPNLHLTESGIRQVVRDVKRYGTYSLPSAVYLISAGVSAAVIIHRLHDALPNSWFIDCGSIWDAFVGIGGQREWRRWLYADPKKLIEWKGANLNGTSYTPPEPGEGTEQSRRGRRTI